MENTLEKLLSKKANGLERKRKATIVWAKFYKLIIAPIKTLLRACCFILAIACSVFPPLIIYLFGCGVAYVLLEIFNNPLKVYNHNFKNNILPKIYKEINPSVSYNASAIQIQDLKKSGLFKTVFSNNKMHFEGNDFISGTINSKAFSVNEIEVFNQVNDYAKTLGGCLFSILLFPIFIVKNLFSDYAHDDELPFIGIVKKKVIIHKGLFINASLSKDIKDSVVVISKEKDDNSQMSTKEFSHKLTDLNNKLIKERYNVYSYKGIATPVDIDTFISPIIHTVSVKNQPLPTVTISNNQLYVFIPMQRNLFNVSIKDKIKNAAFFKPFLADINYINTVVSKIN